MIRTYRQTLVAATMAATLIAVDVEAQACIGGPERSSIALESTAYSIGTAIGGIASLAGKRTAIDVGFRARSIGDDISGIGGGLRFSLIFPAGKFRICPGLGLGVVRDKWTLDASTSQTATTASARAGVGFGFEQPVVKDVSVIPFVGVYYRFNATAFSIDAPGETFTTADSVSHVQIEYGVFAHYRFLFAGIAAERTSKTEGSRADLGRIIIGLTSSGARSSGKAQARRRD